MLLGVVSDTHGHELYTLDAIRVLQAFQVEQVLHCGDIGSIEIPPLFTDWRTHFVFGNVDREEAALTDSILSAGHHSYGNRGSLRLADRHVAFLHGHDNRLFQQTVRENNLDLVCYGHTHRAEQHLEGSTLVLNPGAVYRANPHSVAVVDLHDMSVEIIPF